MFNVDIQLGSRKINIETGKIAKQANGSVIVRCGGTVVMVTACMGADKGGDFLPLTIDYIEKTYAAGKIPGGYFKREGKLSEEETLVSRVIDRPCRPLFAETFTREVQIVATVLSADPDADADVLSICGASAAMHISDIPFAGPLAGVRVCRIDNKLVLNPTKTQAAKADINFIVAGTKDAILMVEGGANQVAEKDILEAIFFAHAEMQILIQAQEDLRAKCGRPKFESAAPAEDDKAMVAAITKFATPKIDAAIRIKDKLERRDVLSAASKEVVAEFVKDGDADADKKAKLVSKVLSDLNYNLVRQMAFKEKRRIDGRDFVTVRPIDIEVGLLPRVHGSALFTRGETQSIVTTTLGISQDAQRLDSLFGESTSKFMLHYNFPGYSVGETKPMRGPGRREIGHGALARRALVPVLPNMEQYPYVIRLVSEITESNGSSSMATVCGGSLALMDAGVPLAAPVAGVAMGLMKEGNDCVILTDILGDEDHLGDMDFKVCGTEKGITALQMDIKIQGLSQEIMTNALEQAKAGRLHILGKLKDALGQPRTELSAFAPRIVSFKVSQGRIKDIIGSGGKTIRSLCEVHEVKIEVADDGTVTIAGSSAEKLNAAVAVCKSLTAEAEVGKIYKGVVKKIASFGAIVEILPGVDGLLHITQISDKRIEEVEDILSLGDEVPVKVLEVERQTGKIKLSMKEALAEQQSLQ